MANRSLLHFSHLESFKEWLQREGYQIVPTKAWYEVLRAENGKEDVVIYRKGTASEHYTVPEKNMRIIRRFIRERSK